MGKDFSNQSGGSPGRLDEPVSGDVFYLFTAYKKGYAHGCRMPAGFKANDSEGAGRRGVRGIPGTGVELRVALPYLEGPSPLSRGYRNECTAKNRLQPSQAGVYSGHPEAKMEILALMFGGNHG